MDKFLRVVFKYLMKQGKITFYRFNEVENTSDFEELKELQELEELEELQELKNLAL